MSSLHEQVASAPTISDKLEILSHATNSFEHETGVADRSAFDRLTGILTAIYSFGLPFLESEKTRAQLRSHMAENCQLSKSPLGLPKADSSVNPWGPVIKMAMGHKHPSETVQRNHPTIKDRKTSYPLFIPNDRLIKYAVALRALQEAGIKPEGVYDYVRDFKPSRKGGPGFWNGIMEADRAARKASGQTTGRKMQDAGKLEAAARNLLAEADIAPEKKAHVSTSKAEFCLVWGYMSEGVFVPGERVAGDNYDAKARTLAEAYGTESEKQAPQVTRPDDSDFDAVEQEQAA